MPSANDGEQYKDNNNIVKYLESNKDSILNLTEKHYESVVEALTDNTLDTAAAPSSSTSTLQLPSSSSSTFSGPSDQSDIYGIEKSESFHK
jgi:spore cortex formation protein SpoVR/YcgB (stage V sporulation)